MSALERWFRALHLANTVSWLEAAFRLQLLPAPKDEAIKVVAKREGKSEHHLRDILKRDLRDLPQDKWGDLGLFVSRDGRRWLEGFLREMVNTGRVRLDRKEGFISLDADQIDPAIRRYREAKARRSTH
jgi:hypothetical protein